MHHGGKKSPGSGLPKCKSRRCCCRQRLAGQEKWGRRGGPKLLSGIKPSSMLLLWTGSGLTVMAPVFTKRCVRPRRHLRPFFVLCVSSFCWGYTYLGDLSCNLYLLELNWIQGQCLSSWPYCTWVCVFVHGFGYHRMLSQCPVSGCHLGICWCFRAMMPLGLLQWGYRYLQCQLETWWDVGQASVNDHVLEHCSAAAWVSVDVHDLCCHQRTHGCPATGLPVVAR